MPEPRTLPSSKRFPASGKLFTSSLSELSPMAQKRLRGSCVIVSDLWGQVVSSIVHSYDNLSVVRAAFNEQVALARHGRRSPFGCQTEIRRKTDETTAAGCATTTEIPTNYIISNIIIMVILS